MQNEYEFIDMISLKLHLRSNNANYNKPFICGDFSRFHKLNNFLIQFSMKGHDIFLNLVIFD